MKRIQLLLPIALLMSLLSAAFFVHAICNPTDIGTVGNDTIDCDLANQPVSDVEGREGDDTITIASGVTTANDVYGEGVAVGTGSDTITNNGNVGNIIGDGGSGADGSDTIINNGTAADLYGDNNVAVAANGSDTITNTGTVNYIYGDSLNGAGSGSDVITNTGTVNNDVIGDSFNGAGNGNDTIINDGVVTVFIIGDSSSNSGTGSDTIVNNNLVGSSIYGDSRTGAGSANDSITNNGTVVSGIIGDGDNVGSGNDTITNNGSAGNIFADSVVGGTNNGNDTVVNNGSTNNIFADGQFGTGTGNDTVINGGTVNNNILAGGGSDTVIIQANSAQVGGTIDGGAGYDVLTFNATSTDPAQLRSWAEQIAAANPAGGTITIAGHSYTWTNFEELTQLLFTLARINGMGDPLAVFCSLTDGLDVYAVRGNEGFLSLTVSAQTISNGIAAAAENGDIVQLGNSAEAVVYATVSGDLLINAPNGFSFEFAYQNYCGTLPVAGVVVVDEEAQEEQDPAFSIINQPYTGG